MKEIQNYKHQKLDNGKAESIKDFFDKIVKDQFKYKDVIIKIHNSLMEYIKMPETTFFVRLYGSFSKDKYDLLRRGFLTEYPNKYRMVFCDNTFSMLFTGFKLAGVSFTEKDIKELFLQNKLVCSFGLTRNERELSYYSPEGALKVNLNSKGWYLAHINPVGYNFEGKSIKDVFENPDRSEWKKSSKIRTSPENLTEQQVKILKAHFIRLIHPLNSFLVPKRNHLIYNGNNIGEEPELLLYVQSYLRNEFAIQYKEFENLSMGYKIESSKPEMGKIMWFNVPNSKKSKNIGDNKKIKTQENQKEKLGGNDEEKLVINLDKWMESIGKEVFVEILFPEIQKNSNITVIEIAEKYSRFKDFKDNNQKTRLSSSKSIFKYGLEKEALQIIIDSKRVKPEVKEKAIELLDVSTRF